MFRTHPGTERGSGRARWSSLAELRVDLFGRTRGSPAWPNSARQREQVRVDLHGRTPGGLDNPNCDSLVMGWSGYGAPRPSGVSNPTGGRTTIVLHRHEINDLVAELRETKPLILQELAGASPETRELLVEVGALGKE